MKRNQLLKHLEKNKCMLYREGSNHSIYCHLLTKKKTSIPRHPDVIEATAINICKQLGIPKPKFN